MGRRDLEALGPTKKKNRTSVEETKDLDSSFVDDDEGLPPGLILSDLLEKKWRIGKPIGRGSFGRIYLASDQTDKEVTKQNARYVVKIEPHTNGPLFVEIHCLIRTAKAHMVKEWRLKHKSKCLGMPIYIGSGSFLDKKTNIKYRFLILPRCEVDLEKVITTRGHFLDLKNVLILAKQIVEVLEYIHESGYTHSDIKSSNLMVGFDAAKFESNEQSAVREFKKPLPVKSVKKPSRPFNYYYDKDYTLNDDGSSEFRPKKSVKKMSESERRNYRYHALNLRQLPKNVNYEDISSSVCSDRSYQQLIDQAVANNDDEAILKQSNGQIYLLDFGLASKFLDANGNHKEFCMDQRKAHDGTLEYSSRDSHIGAHSRRSDLETLAFNILDWLTGTLPWKTAEVLAEPDIVHALKKSCMKDVKTLLKTCFKSEFYPEFLEKYLEYVTSLDFSEKPNYNYCKNLFVKEFIKNGYGIEKDMSLNFTNMSQSSNKKINYSKRFGKNVKTSPYCRLYGRENLLAVEYAKKLKLVRKSSSDRVRKPCASINYFVSEADLSTKLKHNLLPLDHFSKKLSPKVLRSKKKMIKKKKGRNGKSNIGKFGEFNGRQCTWAEVLARDPERIIRKERNLLNDAADTSKCRTRKNSNTSDCSFEGNTTLSPLLQKDYLKDLNPTYAMIEVLANFRKKNCLKTVRESENSKSDGVKKQKSKMADSKAKKNEPKACGRRLRTAKQVETVENVDGCDKYLRKRKKSESEIEILEPTKKMRKASVQTQKNSKSEKKIEEPARRTRQTSVQTLKKSESEEEIIKSTRKTKKSSVQTQKKSESAHEIVESTRKTRQTSVQTLKKSESKNEIVEPTRKTRQTSVQTQNKSERNKEIEEPTRKARQTSVQTQKKSERNKEIVEPTRKMRQTSVQTRKKSESKKDIKEPTRKTRQTSVQTLKKTESKNEIVEPTRKTKQTSVQTLKKTKSEKKIVEPTRTTRKTAPTKVVCKKPARSASKSTVNDTESKRVLRSSRPVTRSAK